MILENAGLKDNRLSDILIGDLSAFPLQNIYRALLVQTTKLTEKELKIIDSLFNGVAKLAENRNKILHSKWSIDFKNPQDIKDQLITGHKPGYSKRGAKPNSFKVPIAEIRVLSQRARVLEDLIYQLNLIVYSGRSIGSYFHLSPDGQAATDGTMADLLVLSGDKWVIRSKK